MTFFARLQSRIDDPEIADAFAALTMRCSTVASGFTTMTL
jgi:hypothetical protein